MSGNVYEWTGSEYKECYDGSEERCSDQADWYSFRGGSLYSQPRWVRAAYRNGDFPDDRGNYLGFRLAQD